MKYKKYFLVIIISLFLCCNRTYAAEGQKNCWYSTEEFKARLVITYGRDWIFLNPFDSTKTYANVKIEKLETKITGNTEAVSNWYAGSMESNCTAGGVTCFPDIYEDVYAANKDTNPSCPQYMVFESGPGGFFGIGTYYKTWATNDLSLAKKAVNSSNQYDGKHKGYYAPMTTEDDYYDSIKVDLEGTKIDKNDCEGIFGNKNDEDSIRNVIDTVLQYVRWIVPPLIIILSIIDFLKAIIANKEDVMTKSKNDFFKRLVIGVSIFFIPVLVDLVMSLADIVWEGLGYTSCGI